MAPEVDARGLSCPQPVVLTRRAIEANVFPIQVIVDSVTSRENVRRLAQKQGLTVSIAESGSDFVITLDRP